MRKILLVIPVIALVGGSSLAILASPQTQSGAVDGWVIGDPVSCPQIGASSAAQCQDLVDRAVTSIPSAAYCVRVTVYVSDGKRHAAAFGCAGVAGASSTRDPLCPNGGAPFP